MYLLNRNKNSFEPYAEEHKYIGQIVTNIIEDDVEHLWVTTNTGLIELSIPDNNNLDKILHFTKSDGLQDNFFNLNASFKSDKGILFFGGNNGLNYIKPNERQASKNFYPIMLTDLKIFNQSFRELPKSEREAITSQSLDHSNVITLSHDKNNFTLEFAVLNYADPSQNLLAYKLEGYDHNWIYTDYQKSFAHYSNLRSGTYKLYMQGTNVSGEWFDAENSVTIKVLPPFWLSTKAYVLYTLTLFLIIVLIIRAVRNRSKLKHQLKMIELRKQKTDEVNHNKLQFFTNITHELMTPLTIISASLADIKSTTKEENLAIQSIKTNVLRLIRLIQQILEFRKVGGGKAHLCVTQGDLDLFIRNSIASFRPLIKSKNLTITFESNMDEGTLVYFDPDKVDKIMYNLLSNAAKYNSENGSITVKLNYNTLAHQVVISVIDTGEGIEENLLPTLFQHFYEGKYRSYNTMGTGIGLALTKDLVTLHKGEIKVESKVGVGSTFTIVLPSNKDSYDPYQIDESITIRKNAVIDALVDEGEELPSSEVTFAETRHLLLVEDNLELLYAMNRIFSSKYNVFTATNGAEAIDILKEKEIHIIISDIMMPEIDGLSLCQYTKSHLEYSHIPVILLTAKQTEEDMIEGYKYGADSYFAKPPSFPLLYARVDNLLEKAERVKVDFRKQLVFDSKELDYNSIDQDFLQQAVDTVNKYLSDADFDLTKFVSEMFTSRTTLNDKLKSLTGLTPIAFINHIRLNAARLAMEKNPDVQIAEVAFSVGFNDPRYFSTAFKKKYGSSPSDYIHQIHNKEE